jgi:glycerophosphoryl diester phosphodiesterase
MADQIIISSFDHCALQYIKEINKSIATGLLYDAVWISFETEIELLKPYSIHPSIESYDQKQAIIAQKKGIKVYPWVAVHKEEIIAMQSNSTVNGVMVNDLRLFDD